MYQPRSLQTDEYVPWSRGRGHDVWNMLESSAGGDLKTIQALAGKDPDLIDCEFEYCRPLHFAIREGHWDVVQFLLDQGADPMCGGLGFQPSYRPHDPGSLPWPLTVARERGHHEIVALLESILRERFHIRPAEGEPLAALIRERDSSAVVAHLDAHPTAIDAADEFGNQPIHWAVMTRQRDLIDRLLERGADVNAQRPDGARPLDLTNGDYWYRGWRDLPREALRPHEVVMGYLLAHGAYYDIGTAAKLGDLRRVQELLDEDPALVDRVPPPSGYYHGVPIRNAAKHGHLSLVQFLLERGADPNQPEAVAPQGGALYEAIAGKHWEIVNLLIAHGANAQAAVESSGNCYWRAKRDEAPQEMLNLLAAHGGTLDVELACHDGDLQTMAAMLFANPDLDVREHLDTDNVQLVDLVRRYQPDVLKGMLFRGAKSLERAHWLLEQGMEVKRGNWLEITPLHRFALEGNLDMAALCLEFGAEANALDDEYASTPLGWAARAGKKEMVTWLLSKGAGATLPAGTPWAQPFAWAARGGHDEVVEILKRSRGQNT